VAVLTLTR